VLYSESPAWKKEQFAPRECCVVDVGTDWLTVGVGLSWPAGLWEARRRPGTFGVALERAAPQAPLQAQREALELTRKGKAGEAAELLASGAATVVELSAAPPLRLTQRAPAAAASAAAAAASTDHGAAPPPTADQEEDDFEAQLRRRRSVRDAIAAARREASFTPNPSQVCMGTMGHARIPSQPLSATSSPDLGLTSPLASQGGPVVVGLCVPPGRWRRSPGRSADASH
jgi:hypothetical protein